MRNFWDSLKASGALKWLLVWGVVILVVVLLVHFVAKKGGSSGDTAAADAAAAAVPPTSVKNVTILNNGYPPTSSSGGGGGGVTPIISPPQLPPAQLPPGSRPTPTPTKVRSITLPRAMTWGQIAQAYAGGSQNAAWVLSWNNQLHSKPWWTVHAGTQVNIPYH